MKTWEPRDNFQHIVFLDFGEFYFIKNKRVKAQISAVVWISELTQTSENHQTFQPWKPVYYSVVIS